MTSHSEQFARELVAIDAASLTDEDLAQVERLLYDYSVVAYGGSALPWVQKLHRWAERSAPQGTAQIVGSGALAPADVAAHLNGAAAHSYELDDTHAMSLSHPGSVVNSAALAVAQERDAALAPGELAAAIIAGYEAMGRLGRAAVAAPLMGHGFHPTALLGPFGASVAAGKLLGHGVEELLVGWGHALSACSGSTQFSQDARGTDIKRLHAGLAARNGVQAAQMADVGLGAPYDAITGRYGFLALYAATEPELDALQGSAAGSRVIHELIFKPYASCGLLHATVDALAIALADREVTPETIESIRIGVQQKAIDQHMERRPVSAMSAQYSLPFAVGATLTAGPWDYSVYERLEGPEYDEILAYGDRVEVYLNEEFERDFPTRGGSEIEVRLVDGTTRSATVRDSLGSPNVPMSVEQLRRKGDGLIGDVDPDFDFDQLTTAVRAAAVDSDTARLAETLARASACEHAR